MGHSTTTCCSAGSWLRDQGWFHEFGLSRFDLASIVVLHSKAITSWGFLRKVFVFDQTGALLGA